MKSTKKIRTQKLDLLSRTVFLVLLLNPILVTPFWNFDSINVPRFTLLAISSSIAAIILLKRSWLNDSLKAKYARNLVLFFLISSTLTIVLSGAPITKQIYGEQGRNTGFLAYFGLLILFVASTQVKSLLNSGILGIALGFGGTLNLIYGLLQIFQLDPVKWQNPFGPVVGMLGNPNFMSSFLGLYTIYLFWRILFLPGQVIIFKTLICFQIILTIFVIYRTQSIQGFFVFCFGWLILILLRSGILRSKRHFLIAGGITIPISSILTLGFLGRGPLGEWFFQSTFQVRLWFWESAVRMIAKNPLLGSGFDSFGDLYREFRPTDIVNLYGPDLVVNAAHNVFLDLAVSGGILLVVLFVSLQIYVFLRSIRYIEKTSELSSEFTLLFSLWAGYNLQSLISINQLSLSIFGFVISGLLLASTVVASQVKDTKIYQVNNKKSHKHLTGYFYAICCVSLVIPHNLNDHYFRESISQNNGRTMINVVNRWPQNEFYAIVISRLLYQNNYDLQARELAYLALKINPRSYSALELIVADTGISVTDREEFANMLRLMDPLNPRHFD